MDLALIKALPDPVQEREYLMGWKDYNRYAPSSQRLNYPAQAEFKNFLAYVKSLHKDPA